MLKKIHIENFKSLKNIDVPCTGLNLLTGVNGAGKSSFIQVLRLLHLAADKIERPEQTISVKDFGGGSGLDDVLYCYANALKNVVITVNYSNDNGCEYEINRILEQSMYLGVDSTSLSFVHPAWPEIFRDAYNESLRLENLIAKGSENVSSVDLDLADEKASKILAVAQEKFQEEEKIKANEFKSLWSGTRFVDALRQKPTDVSLGGRYDQMSLIWSDPSLVHAFSPGGEDVMEFLYKYGRDANGSQLMEKVNQCLNWVSPGARLSIVEKKVGDNSYYVSAVDYGVDGDVRMFKPQNVGFGVNDILPVLATLLTAEKGNVLIIENPEAHLHPRGQAEIGKLIAETVSRGVQVFIETHSDHVINGIRVAVKKGILKPSDVNIAFFERKEHGVVDDDGKESREIFTTVRDIKVDENGSLSEYPEDFMDEWNNQLMRLM